LKLKFPNLMNKAKPDHATSPRLSGPGFNASCSCPWPHTYTPHDTSTISKWSLTVLERTKVNKSNKTCERYSLQASEFIMMVGTLASFFVYTSDKKNLKLTRRKKKWKTSS